MARALFQSPGADSRVSEPTMPRKSALGARRSTANPGGKCGGVQVKSSSRLGCSRSALRNRTASVGRRAHHSTSASNAVSAIRLMAMPAVIVLPAQPDALSAQIRLACNSHEVENDLLGASVLVQGSH